MAPTRTIYRLVAWTRYFDPVERVWAVKCDPDLVRGEFPAWSRFDVVDFGRYAECFDREEPCDAEGVVGPAHIRWPVHLEAVRRHAYFRDTSNNALFRHFQHEHIFEPTHDGSRYLDRVTFEPAGGPSGAWAGRVQGWVARATERLFVHRHRASVVHLHADPHATAVTALRRLFDDELAHAFSTRS